jgi:hypothetical protein
MTGKNHDKQMEYTDLLVAGFYDSLMGGFAGEGDS